MTSRPRAGRRAVSAAVTASTAVLLTLTGCAANGGNGDSVTKNGVIEEPSPTTTVGDSPLVNVLQSPPTPSSSVEP